MAQVFFDTLKFVKTLESAGVPTLQAEAFANVVRDSHEAAEVATKADIIEVKRDLEDVRKDISHTRQELESKISQTRHELESKIDKLGLQLTVKFGGMLVVAVGVLAAIIKLPL